MVFDNGDYTAEDLRAGELLFAKECGFIFGADASVELPPPTIGEIAFTGRSNVGKSSLINALTNRKGLARSSNTPGRTQQINFFDLGGVRLLIDLPGYGYAAASKTKIAAWNQHAERYLLTRNTLKMVLVLVDARHGLKDLDREMMEGLARYHISFAVVLTKADKINLPAIEKVVAETRAAAGKDVRVFPVSAAKKDGIPALRAFLAQA